jgi:hypothetical protein
VRGLSSIAAAWLITGSLSHNIEQGLVDELHLLDPDRDRAAISGRSTRPKGRREYTGGDRQRDGVVADRPAEVLPRAYR